MVVYISNLVKHIENLVGHTMIHTACKHINKWQTFVQIGNAFIQLSYTYIQLGNAYIQMGKPIMQLGNAYI